MTKHKAGESEYKKELEEFNRYLGMIGNERKKEILALAEELEKENIVSVGSICTRIMHDLKNEIKEGLISWNTIFRALPEEYKSNLFLDKT